MIQNLFFVPVWNLGKTGQKFLKVSKRWSFQTISECRKHVTLFKKIALVPKKAAKLRKERMNAKYVGQDGIWTLTVVVTQGVGPYIFLSVHGKNRFC